MKQHSLCNSLEKRNVILRGNVILQILAGNETRRTLEKTTKVDKTGIIVGKKRVNRSHLGNFDVVLIYDLQKLDIYNTSMMVFDGAGKI
jgi:hypothetical protein